MGLFSKEKRAYGVTSSEVSAVFWGISLLVSFMVILNLNGMRAQVAVGNPGLAMTFSFMMSLIMVSLFLSFMSMVLPNYQITKHNLNIIIDKISNPDFIGWFRFTRDKGMRLHTVKKDIGGRTKGVVNDKKASVINNGDYTLNVPNGNKLLCVYDFLSNNANIEECVGWELVNKHFGIIGFKAYEKAVETDKLLFKDITPVNDDEDDVEEVSE